MSQNIHPEDILFIDIETVPAFPSLSEAPVQEQALWEKKSLQLAGRTNEATVDYHRAGIYAEFGKIICVSCGRLKNNPEGIQLSISTFAANSELGLLKNLSEFLSNQKHQIVLCAHNGKEFDYPYLSRRFLINKLPLPGILNLAGKKPWEIKHLDTLELWKFGDYKHYTSLEVLAHVFGIPSPKASMDGSRVAEVYYEHHDLKTIRNYCENDIHTLVLVYLHQINQLQWVPEIIEVARIN
jgi:3'-5' exonuclease